LYFYDNYYISNVFTEIIGMAPPINVQDWYGDRHTCQIASGALARRTPSHRTAARAALCSLARLQSRDKKTYKNYNVQTQSRV